MYIYIIIFSKFIIESPWCPNNPRRHRAPTRETRRRAAPSSRWQFCRNSGSPPAGSSVAANALLRVVGRRRPPVVVRRVAGWYAPRALVARPAGRHAISRGGPSFGRNGLRETPVQRWLHCDARDTVIRRRSAKLYTRARLRIQ